MTLSKITAHDQNEAQQQDEHHDLDDDVGLQEQADDREIVGARPAERD